MKQERAGGNGLVRHSTKKLPNVSQFEFWRSLYGSVELDLNDPSSVSSGYDAEALIGAMPNGIVFGASRSSNTSAVFGTPDNDGILVSVTLSGSAIVHDKDRNAQVVNSGSGAVLIDMRKSYGVTSRAEHAHVYLSIPRALAFSDPNHDPFANGFVVGAADRQGLKPFLAANLKMLHDNADSLTAGETEIALNLVADVALACLNLRPESDDIASSRAMQVSYAAACDYIDRSLGNHDLTADAIAAGLGYSRAHLYRLFASHSQTVAEVLRDRRLERARLMIDVGRMSNVESIAFAVGYQSPSSFSRAFKARFGQSPRDYRAMRGAL